MNTEMEKENEKTWTCFGCDSECNGEAILDANGNAYCSDCASEYLVTCDCCDEIYHINEMTFINHRTEMYCPECVARRTQVCSDCGDFTTEFHLTNTEQIICDDCFEENYTRCEDCGCIIHNDDSFEHHGELLCSNCYDDRRENDEEDDDDNEENINEYSYKPYPKFKHTETDTETIKLYLGFELEAGGADCSDRNSTAEKVLNESDNENYFYLKHDSSIPDYGFELVSHPMTLKFHQEYKWESILKIMSSGGLRSFDLDSACGLHIHASKAYLTPYRWMLIEWLILKNREKFMKIAQRKGNSYAFYNDLPNKNTPDRPHLKDVLGESDKRRYRVVNFNNKNTVEFRMFRGTLKYSSFISMLEIVDALVKWAKKTCIHNILKCKDAFGDFLEFVKANPEPYKHAIAYLKSKNITA